MVGILRRNDPLGIGVRRRLPERCRHLIADAFVGSLLIVAPAEGVELPLLAAQGVRRRPRRLALELAVHAFMGRVLLGTRRMNPLMDDAELHPPHVQPAQAVDASRRERCPVVGPDRFGEADLSEQGAEHGFRLLGLHRRQAAARKERPAEVIGDRQRVAVLPVSGLELPLEVRRPHLVRSLRLERSGSRVRPLLATPVLAEPAVPLEDGVDRTARRPGDRGRSRPEHLQELLRSPSVLQAGGEDQRLDLRRRPMRARVRRPASLGHPRAARLPKAAHPLVTGRPRHTVPLAELRHRPLAAFQVLREPQPLFRLTRLHPGHLLGVNDVPGLLLTMCPGRTPSAPHRCLSTMEWRTLRACSPPTSGATATSPTRLPTSTDTSTPTTTTTTATSRISSRFGPRPGGPVSTPTRCSATDGTASATVSCRSPFKSIRSGSTTSPTTRPGSLSTPASTKSSPTRLIARASVSRPTRRSILATRPSCASQRP